jgi:DNA repair protein RecN (Recombination protein N)
VSRVQRILESAQALGAPLTETAETLKTAYYQLEETARDIEHFSDGLRADPARLTEYLDRQDLLHKLQRKYGATAADVLAYREKIAGELDVLARSDENRQDLERKVEQQKAALLALCAMLSGKRKKAAEKLARGVEKELQDLGMKKARFSVAFEQEAEPTGNGFDRLEFMFSANPGERLGPL